MYFWSTKCSLGVYKRIIKKKKKKHYKILLTPNIVCMCGIFFLFISFDFYHHLIYLCIYSEYFKYRFFITIRNTKFMSKYNYTFFFV